MTADIIKKDKITLDNEGFEAEMERQRERAQEAWKGSGEEAIAACYLKTTSAGVITEFCGYENVTKEQSKVTAIFMDGSPVQTIAEGQARNWFSMKLLFTARPVVRWGDTGYLEGDGFYFEVQETKKPLENFIVHKGVVKKEK